MAYAAAIGLAAHEALALSRGVALSLTTDAGVPQVPADAAYIERALTNLISNAIKFTAEGGAVELHVGADRDRLVIAVRDTGAGIPSDELAGVFEKYTRGRDSAGVEGSGLGLFIVRAVVERHGGTVDVDSVLGAGSTFTIRLPLVTFEHAALQAASC